MEKKLSGEVLYNGIIVRLEKDLVLCPNGKESYREIVRHNGGAAVLAIIDDKIILVKQFRYAYNEYLFEIPAGKLEKEEDPLVASARELEEETGYKPQSMEFLGVIYPTCGYCDEKIYLYYASDFVKTKQHLDENEFLDVYLIDFAEVLKMIENGQIKDAKTICAINYYLLKKSSL